ncbi:hypothetical protein NLU13_9498 [Sarocladium strictum]|uniref:DUF4048 domain-containing protein n=1 Tax=Sarocladium strictum TaxID=5046 RepID=A0AA39GA80_SARSR|nr:hypothetical protein NLU13_9498 [Sarocladium strictum]
MTSLFFRVCTANHLPKTLLNEEHRLRDSYYRALVARASARLRRIRAFRAPATHLQKRRKISGCYSLQKLIQRHPDMASNHHQQLRRRCSSAADRASVEPLAEPEATTTTLSTPEHSSPTIAHEATKMGPQSVSCGTTGDAKAMPPPPLPTGVEAASPTRQSRSTSTASRNANRLSLTLPIALPTSDPSRPTPTSAVSGSVPPTPIDSPAMKTPSGTNEFIIAVAAQERRVLELREELARAEADLIKLKKQWTAQEAQQKRASLRQLDLSRTTTPTPDDEPRSARLSADLDRRRSLLLNQGTPTSTPGRRRVLRGGHTRTLSLLSPAKSDSGFAVHEDREHEAMKLPSGELRSTQPTNPTLPKRSSWQPRLQPSQLQQAGGAAMPQLVEDFKLGFRAFVEDIRQITVGEEPINGQNGAHGHGRSTAGTSTTDDSKDHASRDQNTIRPTQPSRPNVVTTFDLAGSLSAGTPTPPARTRDAGRDNVKPTKNKRFSWTPLGFDSLDDTDWSNWESPASTKSSRWSGSTVNTSATDDTPSIPENEETTSSRFELDTPLSPSKLKEIIPSMVNGFSPSNLKRTATTLMTEWEKSLITPEDPDKENEM